MPNVKGKKFPYTPEGEAAAEEYAAKTGSPFMMKAKKYGNSPMKKNFGSSLAINKKLDKDNMQGGLTGKPSGETGKLGHGPILKKKGGGAALKFREDVNKLDKKIQTGAAKVGGKFKKSISNLASSLKLKPTGNIGDKVRSKYSPKARKSKPSKSTGFKTHGYDGGFKAPEAPKSKTYTKPKSKIKVDPFVGNPAEKGTTKNTYGVDRLQENKKTKAYKPWSPQSNIKTTKTSSKKDKGKSTLRKFGTPGWPSMKI
tara:strand:+ start:2649 stop:3416 length:768 start_codon:yes stop_codon:yes gene_type:complete